MAEVLASNVSMHSLSEKELKRQVEPILAAPQTEVEPVAVEENPNVKASNITGFTPQQAAQILVNVIPKNLGDYRNFQLAYGRRAIPKLVFELTQGLEIRQAALISLSELLHNPESIAQALNQDVIDKLVKLKDEELTTRQKTTQCLSSIATHEIGRSAIISKKTMFELSNLLNDACPVVRRNTYQTLLSITSQRQGVASVMKWSCIPILVDKLPKERFDIQIIILGALYNCLRMGSRPFNPDDAIEAGAMQVFTDLLSPESVTDVKVGAAKCIMMLCFFQEGKKISTQGKTIPILINALRDMKSPVRAAAAGALMSISTNVDAKKIIVRENAIGSLIELLNDKDESVLLNCVKAITNCAEDYRGRFQLHASLKRLEELKNTSEPKIAAAATQAIKTITWRP